MKPLLNLTLAASLAGIGTGATIVQTGSYSFVPTGAKVLTFDKFDSSLGTLVSVTITTNLSKSGGSLFVDNDSGTAASGNISQSVTINLTSEDVDLLAAPSGTIGSNITATSFYSASVTSDDGDGPGFQTGGSDYDGTNFGVVSASQTKTVRALVMSEYEGTGTFAISVGGTQGFDTTAVGGAAATITPATASGDVTVTYTYTAIPEPACALLGGMGFLILLRRRR